MQTSIHGITSTETGYAVKDFLHPERELIPVQIHPETYEAGVSMVAGRYCPESFRLYLMAVKDVDTNKDTWDNLIFTGHAYGCYNHKKQTFQSARSLGMHAESEIEVAYVEALEETAHSLRQMLNLKK